MDTRKDRQTLKWMDRRRDIIMCLKKKGRKNRQRQLVERGNMDRQTTLTTRERAEKERHQNHFNVETKAEEGGRGGIQTFRLFEIFNDG